MVKLPNTLLELTANAAAQLATVRLQLEQGASMQDSACRAKANRSSACRYDGLGLLVCPACLRRRSNAWGDAK